MGGVDGQAHVREMEAVAQSYEGQTDNVVAHELPEVFSWLLHAEHQDNGLLSPVGGLEEVIKFEAGLVGAVGESLVHAAGIVIPDGGAAHDVDAGGTEEGKVDGRVRLFHETGLLGTGTNARATGQGLEELLHDELACEGEDDGVEGDEGDVVDALAIVDGRARGRGQGVVGAWFDGIGEENKFVDRVPFGRIEGIKEAEDGQEDGREYIGALNHGLANAGKEAASAAAFGDTLVRIGLLGEGFPAVSIRLSCIPGVDE